MDIKTVLLLKEIQKDNPGLNEEALQQKALKKIENSVLPNIEEILKFDSPLKFRLGNMRRFLAECVEICNDLEP